MSEKKPKNQKPKHSKPRQKRTIEIAIRVNEEELALLKQRQQGATMAGWLRGLALGVQSVKPADAELVRALGRIGSNLNQVARYVNTERAIDQQVLVEIEQIRQVMHHLLADNMTMESEDGYKSGELPHVG